MFTRRHYESVAYSLLGSRPSLQIDNDYQYGMLVRWNIVVENFTWMFSQDNANFDPAKFRKACGYDLNK
jgi:hypothetical protein